MPTFIPLGFNSLFIPRVFVLGYGCDWIWTAGVATVSGGLDFVWNMTTHTKPLTYANWGVGEPNNYNGLQEDSIMFSPFFGGMFDLTADLTLQTHSFASAVVCYACEYTII